MDKGASGDRSRESLGSRSARDKPSSSERLVRKEGFEPPRPFGHKILSLARLPVPPLPQWSFYSTSLATRAPPGFCALPKSSPCCCTRTKRGYPFAKRSFGGQFRSALAAPPEATYRCLRATRCASSEHPDRPDRCPSGSRRCEGSRLFHARGALRSSR